MKGHTQSRLFSTSLALALGAASALLNGCATREGETSRSAASANVQPTLAPRPSPPAALVTFYNVPFR